MGHLGLVVLGLLPREVDPLGVLGPPLEADPLLWGVAGVQLMPFWVGLLSAALDFRWGAWEAFAVGHWWPRPVTWTESWTILSGLERASLDLGLSAMDRNLHLDRRCSSFHQRGKAWPAGI